MNASQVLLLVAGGLFAYLGLAHAALTLRDLVKPTAFTPTDEAVRRAMGAADVAAMPGTNLWRAWLGVNLTHSLGLLLFAGVLLVLATGEDAAIADRPLAAVALVGVAASYLIVAARFFFAIPAIIAALVLACLVGSWLAA